ncbi:MAG: hypothetical protein WCT99_03140 [Bacteroidota bacterium]|jgi:hypothetical protein
MKNKILLILFVGCWCSSMSAQAVYLPATHQVYQFLEKMETKGFIPGFRDAVKPLTRENIARALMQLDSTYTELNEIEQEELAFYKEEFFQELKNLQYDLLLDERWHLYQYESTPGLFNIDLIGGWSYEDRADGKFRRSRHNGLQAYGYAGNNVGIYFYYRDNREAGTYLDNVRQLSPEPAEVVTRGLKGAIEYDDLDAQMTYQNSFMTLSVEKMHNVWGNGDRGQLILSNKSPSYPQIKLQMKLGKNVDFTYLHGWLYSGIVDSLRSFQVADIPGQVGYRTIYKQKYIAAHMMEMTPWNGVDIAIGESEIYGSRNPELLYLIPFMFFKAGEHWMYDTDNSQMFASFDFNVITNYNFYTSVFIDEFSMETFYRTDRQRNQVGFTVGGKSYDQFLDNSMLQLEYTRLNPWVYNHKYPDATFQSHSVDLGHWLGQNGDLFYVGFDYQFSRSLRGGVQLESIRKGGKDSTKYQYRLPTPEFLYSPITKEQTVGIWATYEPIRDFLMDFRLYQQRFTTQESWRGKDYAKEIGFSFSMAYNVH